MRSVAVLFDFDGVVVDSLSEHVAAWDRAFRKLFGEALSPEQRKTIVGHSTRNIAKMLAGDKGSDAVQVLIERKRDELINSKESIAPLPGTIEIFRYLRQEGLPFGIASNAPRAFVQETLARLRLAVDVVLGVEDVHSPKPAPDLFLLCAKRLGISVTRHHEIVVFEDSTHGVEAAVAAGMVAVGVKTQHPHEVLKAAGASHTVENLLEGLDYLQP